MQEKMAYFRRFGVKEPRHSETISDEKSATSVVARVSCCLAREEGGVFWS